MEGEFFDWSIFNSGAPFNVKNFRSILGSSKVGQRFRALTRANAVPRLTEAAGHRQSGGIAGRSAEFS
eukprot:6749270-Pyramimonas_sp.AAC.1